MGAFVNMADGSYYRVDQSKEEVLKLFRTKGPFVELTSITGAKVTVNANQVTHVQDDE